MHKNKKTGKITSGLSSSSLSALEKVAVRMNEKHPEGICYVVDSKI